MGAPEVKDLFFKSRFFGGWHLLGVLIYTPIGLALALLRVFISLQAYLLALLLIIPELAFIRRFVLRAISLVLGVLVIEENASKRDQKERVLVANNISILDSLPVHLLTFCFSVSEWEVWPLNMKVFSAVADKQAFAAALRSQLAKSSVPLLVQPEGTSTNSRVGLLRFGSWCGNISSSVQPVVLRIWRPLKIAPSTLDASFSTDLFWFLFSPITVFKVRYLPVVTRLENETDEDMADRIAQNIASDLGVSSTKFTAKDKRDYEKRYIAERLRIANARTSHSSNELLSMANYEMRSMVSHEMQRMAQQVSEVLPYVPQEAIIRDLMRTRSVDITISNILEGTVRFTPLSPEPRPAQSSSYPSSSSSSGESLPRSAQDRMMSFVERKTRLIEEARKRYMEKHGLVDQH